MWKTQARGVSFSDQNLCICTIFGDNNYVATEKARLVRSSKVSQRCVCRGVVFGGENEFNDA